MTTIPLFRHFRSRTDECNIHGKQRQGTNHRVQVSANLFLHPAFLPLEQGTMHTVVQSTVISDHDRSRTADATAIASASTADQLLLTLLLPVQHNATTLQCSLSYYHYYCYYKHYSYQGIIFSTHIRSTLLLQSYTKTTTTALLLLPTQHSSTTSSTATVRRLLLLLLLLLLQIPRPPLLPSMPLLPHCYYYYHHCLYCYYY